MKQICCTILLFFAFAGSHAQDFADYFQNKTLRVDYIFTGNAERQNIYLDELSQLPSWAGRQHHLSELPLEGNGQIIVKDLATQQTIYKTSFSSLFHEWLSTDEAKETAKGFENTFLLPFPLVVPMCQRYNAVERLFTQLPISPSVTGQFPHFR